MSPLMSIFGQIDIYLFDQILRGRICPGMRIFDAGCGSGRNIVFFLREGYEVYGADPDPQAVARTRELSTSLAPGLPATNFRVEAIEAMSFPAAFVDVVLSSAVLHFARDEEHFISMLLGVWRVLRPGGLFFCRLASSIGVEGRVKRIAGERYLLPDGSERYLVNERVLMHLTDQLSGELLDPLKTTIVQDQRSMTTWVLRKRG